MFQAPRSGIIVSELRESPRSGKFVSDVMVVHQFLDLSLMFQSPRSGKFVSDENNKLAYVIDGKKVSIP